MALQIQHPNGKNISVSEEHLRRAGVDTSKPVESITQEQYDTILSLIGDQSDALGGNDAARLPNHSDSSGSGAQFTISIKDCDAYVSDADGTTVVITESELQRMNIPFENGVPVIDNNSAQRLAQVAIETMESEKKKAISHAPVTTAPVRAPIQRAVQRSMGSQRMLTPTVRRVTDSIRGPRLATMARPSAPPPRVVGAPASTTIRRVGAPGSGCAVLDRSQMIGKTVKFRDTTGTNIETGQIVEYVEGRGYKVRKQNGSEFYVSPESFTIKTQSTMAAPTPPSTDHHSYPAPTRAVPPASAPTQSFDCAMCSKHINQKAPAYIVIRLPACDECAEQKILVNSVRESNVSSTTKATEEEPTIKKQKIDDIEQPTQLQNGENVDLKDSIPLSMSNNTGNNSGQLPSEKAISSGPLTDLE